MDQGKQEGCDFLGCGQRRVRRYTGIMHKLTAAASQVLSQLGRNTCKMVFGDGCRHQHTPVSDSSFLVFFSIRVGCQSGTVHTISFTLMTNNFSYATHFWKTGWVVL